MRLAGFGLRSNSTQQQEVRCMLQQQAADAPVRYDRSQESYSRWFLLIVAVFITCLITANIIAVKLVVIFGQILPAGVIIFPITYIFGDILTEVYGYRRARQVIWLGFFCNLVVVAAMWVAQ